jgi:hypothetical protein
MNEYPSSLFQHVSPSAITIISTIHTVILLKGSPQVNPVTKEEGYH